MQGLKSAGLGVAFCAKGLDAKMATRIIERAADLLETENNPHSTKFELRVLDILWGRTFGTERNNRTAARIKALRGDTWESKMAEAQGIMGPIFFQIGLFGGELSQANTEEGYRNVFKVIDMFAEVAAFSDCPPSIKNWCSTLQHPFYFGCFGGNMWFMPEYESYLSCDEGKVIEAIGYYKRSVW